MSTIDKYFAKSYEPIQATVESEGYQHVIIRLTNGNDRLEESAEQRAVSWFEREWPAVGRTFALTVYHSFTKEELLKDRSKCNHIHVIYKPYKGHKGTEAIREFVRRFGLRLYSNKVKVLYGLAKYLLQGGGRKVLHQTGKVETGRFYSEHERLWSRREVGRCESDCLEASDEEDEQGNSYDRNNGFGASSTRQAKKVLQAQKVEAVHDVDDLKRLLLKYFVKDETQLIRKMTPDEKVAFNLTKLQTKEWSKMFDQARQLAITSIMDRHWEDIMEEILPDDKNAYTPPVMSVNKSIKILMRILKEQKYTSEQRKQFIRDVYSVMNNNIYRHKRNTLYLFGEVSAGKSLIATSLERSKVYSFNSGEYNSRSSDFYWEDMSLACIAIINEPQIESGKVDKFKIILEGGAFDTNVKFKSKSRVEGVPVIVTTNQEIYRYALEAEPAFRERWYRHDFKHKLPNIGITGELHPKMWLTLIKHMGLNKKPVSEESDSETDLEELLGPAAVQNLVPEMKYTEDKIPIFQIVSEEQKLCPKPMYRIERDNYEFQQALQEVANSIVELYEQGDIQNWHVEPDEIEGEHVFHSWRMSTNHRGDGQFATVDEEREFDTLVIKYNEQTIHCNYSQLAAGSGHNYHATLFAILGHKLYRVYYALNDWFYYWVTADVDDESFRPSASVYAIERFVDVCRGLIAEQPTIGKYESQLIWYGGHGFGLRDSHVGRTRQSFAGWMARAMEECFNNRELIESGTGVFNTDHRAGDFLKCLRGLRKTLDEVNRKRGFEIAGNDNDDSAKRSRRNAVASENEDEGALSDELGMGSPSVPSPRSSDPEVVQWGQASPIRDA